MKPKKPQTFRPHYFGTDHHDDGLCIGPARQGRCYELAGAAVLTSLVGALLVHGSIRVPGSNQDADPYQHAWVVLADGQVWEPIQARLWDAALFWCVMQPVVATRYGHAELLDAVKRTGHWGPWR